MQQGSVATKIPSINNLFSFDNVLILNNNTVHVLLLPILMFLLTV